MMRLAERPKPTPVRAQRKAADGSAATAATPRLEGSRPLDGALRRRMETGFGRDFSQVRVHDGPQAAEAAHAAGALAYTAGNDIVFGADRYAPSTPTGTALLAHELAHTVQQGGVQHKSEGAPASGTDIALEAEADRAAAAIVAGEPAPPLTRMAAPALMRTAKKSAVPSTASPSAGPSSRIRAGMTAVNPPPAPGATEVVVIKDHFTLPLPKGGGPWVASAYKAASEGKRLVFTTDNANESVASWKEEGSSGEYQRVWLRNLGFTSMQALGTAIKASTKPGDGVSRRLHFDG